MTPILEPVPPPQQLFRLWDAGRITREDFHRLMAVHARELIQEMEQAHTNPLLARFYQLLNRREAAKWSRKYGEALIREILCTLAAEEDRFPPSRWLWNAAHVHIPLDCFFRTRGTPVFRFIKLDAAPQAILLTIEHGGTEAMPPQREQFHMRRDRSTRLAIERRMLLTA